MVKILKIVKNARTVNISYFTIKKLSHFIAFSSCVSGLFLPSSKASEIANSSIELKKDVQTIKQKNFKNKDNLVPTVNESLDNSGNSEKIVSEKTILLKDVSFVGNNKFSNKILNKFFEKLLGTNITFSELSNAALEIQSLYREKGFITSRVIIPKQDFLSGSIKIAIIESYLEDIVVTGGTEGTREYIKYMTKNVLKDNQKNKIFKFDDLERQLLLIKKTGIGQLTSTLSKGVK